MIFFFGLIKFWFFLFFFFFFEISIRSVSLGTFYKSSWGFFFFFQCIILVLRNATVRGFFLNLLIIRRGHECFVEQGYRKNNFSI